MSITRPKHIDQPTVLYMDGVSVSFDGFNCLLIIYHVLCVRECIPELDSVCF